MQKVLLYVHGKGGNSKEIEQLKPYCNNYDIYGIDIIDFTPWGTEKQIQNIFEVLKKEYESVSLIANSIGAYFSMFALQNYCVEKAFFISPILDMEKLILDMMKCANVTEKDLKEHKEISTDFGETLSWEYLSFVRNNLIQWNVPTEILYAEHDNMTSQDTVNKFVKTHQAKLTVMPEGEIGFIPQNNLNFSVSG